MQRPPIRAGCLCERCVTECTLAIREQVPGITGEIHVHRLGGPRTRRVEHGNAILLVTNPFYLGQVAPQVGSQQIAQGIDAIQQDQINAVQCQHLTGQRARVRADETDGITGLLLLERRAQRGRRRSVSRAGIRVLTINDEADQAGIGFRDALYRVFNGQALGAAVQNADPEPFGAAALGQQERPSGRLMAERSLLRAW